MRAFQTTTFGEYSGRKTERVRCLINVFRRAGFPSVFCADMDSWQKPMLLWSRASEMRYTNLIAIIIALLGRMIVYA